MMIPVLKRAFRHDLVRIGAPALVAAGVGDRATPPALSEFLASAIPGARLTPIEKAAHISNFERPAIFNGHLRAFLADMAA